MRIKTCIADITINGNNIIGFAEEIGTSLKRTTRLMLSATDEMSVENITPLAVSSYVENAALDACIPQEGEGSTDEYVEQFIDFAAKQLYLRTYIEDLMMGATDDTGLPFAPALFQLATVTVLVELSYIYHVDDEDAEATSEPDPEKLVIQYAVGDGAEIMERRTTRTELQEFGLSALMDISGVIGHAWDVDTIFSAMKAVREKLDDITEVGEYQVEKSGLVISVVISQGV